jgi:hypothetical protein
MTHLLGTDVDSNVAARLGVPTHAVRRKRWKMGIPPYDPSQQRRKFVWTRDKIALLGTDVDRVIAKRLGVSVPTVAIKRAELDIKSYYPQHRIRWTREMIALLGKTSDWKIAERYKIDRMSVARERLRRRVRAFVETRPVKRAPKLKPILSFPIRALAKRYHISSETVARLRHDLGVPTPKRWPDKSGGKRGS